MPCYDSRSDVEFSEQKARERFRHNSDVAELLCGLCQQLESRGLAHEINSSSKRAAWWREHKRRDAERKK